MALPCIAREQLIPNRQTLGRHHQCQHDLTAVMSAILAEALGQKATLLFVGLIVFAFRGKGQRRTIVEQHIHWSLQQLFRRLVRHPAHFVVNRHSTVTHYQRTNMTHLQEGGTGEEVSEILFFSAKSKRRPSLIYSMQIIPVCLSIVARRKGVSATRRGGSNWAPISLLVGHPCKLFHTLCQS